MFITAGDEVWNEVNVNVPERVPVLESLSVNANGTYNAPSNIDGYNTVSVNVPQSGGTGFDFNQLYGVRLRCNGTTLDLTGLNTSTFTNMGEMFYGCGNITSLDISHLDTSNVDNMRQMFASCGKLTSLDVSHFDTSKVTDISYMFYYCENLTSLDLSHFDTSKVTDMAYMFSGCGNLTSLDISHFNTINVTNMSEMFNSCENLTSLDLSHFDTSKVTNMSAMFSGCFKLKSLNISNWDARNVDSIWYMLNALYSLETINCVGLQLPDINMSNIHLDESPKLTVDSIVGLLNALPTTTNGYSFQIGQVNIDKLSEEQKAIATNKNWQLV